MFRCGKFVKKFQVKVIVRLVNKCLANTQSFVAVYGEINEMKFSRISV